MADNKLFSAAAPAILAEYARQKANALWGLVSAPRDAYRGDLQVFDPETGHVSEQAMDAANGMAGLAMTGGLGGAAVKAGETALGAGPIRAYHGSGKVFDKFDLDRALTGAGDASHGHGVYTTTDEVLANHYRNTVAQPTFTHPEFGADLSQAEFRDRLLTAGRAVDPKLSASDASRIIDGLRQSPEWVNTLSQSSRAPPGLASMAREAQAAKVQNGATYELNIDASPSDFFRHDRDRSLYYKLADKLGSERAASDELAKQGIPGIVYDGHRSLFESNANPTSGYFPNYVVFNPSIIDITRRYGLAGAAALGAGAAGLGSPGEAQAAPANALSPYMMGP